MTNPAGMIGKTVIRGTPVPVELLLRKLGGGRTAEGIMAARPRLTLDDAHAAEADVVD